MSKEVIYIDINDDVTSVIDRIKQSDQKIVALVPPKQMALLQSVVNLQLLARAAREVKKYIVLITAKDALMKLAAVAKIPVAKTLQSKPILPKLLDQSIEDELIDGENLPIGELASTTDSGKLKTADVIVDPNRPIELDKSAAKKIKSSKKSKFGVLKIVSLGFGLLAIAAVMVWALVFAPKASIIIKTRTKALNLDRLVNLVEDSSKVNHQTNTIHAQIQRLEKTRSLEFAATGEKNVGSKATGKINLKNVTFIAITIPAGTVFTKDGCDFVSKQAVTIPQPGGNILHPIPVSRAVEIEAKLPGEKCNIAAGTYQTGFIGVLANGEAMTGGSDKIVKVVTKEDLDQAKQKIIESDESAVINELKNKFDSSAIVIKESFASVAGEIKSSVALDEEAPDAKAKLEQPVKYSLVAVVRSRLVDYLNYVALDQEKSAKIKQKVYQSGDDRVQFADFVSKNDSITVKIFTQLRVGPEIDTKEVKDFAKGKAYGEIQDKYQKIEGIEKVELDFWPMWVRRVPNKDDRVTVKIELD